MLFERKISAIPTFGIRIGHLLLGMNIDLDSIAVYRLPFIPSWTRHTPAVNFGLHTGKKSSIDPDTFKLQFCDIINSYPNYIYIYTDGSKEGDSVACAAVSRANVMHLSTTRLFVHFYR